MSHVADLVTLMTMSYGLSALLFERGFGVQVWAGLQASYLKCKWAVIIKLFLKVPACDWSITIYS